MFERIQTHLNENKKLYIGVSIGVLAGVSAMLISKHKASINPELQTAQKMLIVGKARDVNQVMINLIERSTPSKPIHLVGTSQYFDSISEAARQLGLDRTMISKHINGHIPDVKGAIFEVL